MQPTRFIKPVYLTIASLVGLLVGIGLGIFRAEGDLVFLDVVTSMLAPAVSLWLQVLTVGAILLGVVYIMVAITRMRRRKETGKMVFAAVVTHEAMLTTACLVSFAATALFVFFPATNVETMLSAIDLPRPPAISGADSPWGLLRGLLVDPVTAVATGNVMALIMWAAIAGWLLSLLRPRVRDPILRVVESAMQLTQVGVFWLLLFMPLAVFHVALVLTPGAGTNLAGSLGAFLVVLSGIQVTMTGVLFLVAWLVGRIPLRRFAQAVAPAQTLAVGSRSSLVCLPTVVDGARRLRLPPAVSEVVVPLSSGTMRLSQLASHPFDACFLAFLYGIHLEPGALVIFALGLILMSHGAPGVPSAGALTSVPLYLALGIPIEGYLMLKAIDVIPDCFKTVLNVTEHLTVATVAARFRSREAGEILIETDLRPSVVPTPTNQ